MTNRFKKHAPSGMMSAEEWFRLQQTASEKRALSRECPGENAVSADRGEGRVK